MPTISEIDFVPYSTELVLMPPPSCGLVHNDGLSHNHVMILSLWFIMTWPIFITWLISWPASWLIAKLCVKKAEPEPEPEPEPDDEEQLQTLLSNEICELLRKGSFTARDIFEELSDLGDAGYLDHKGNLLTITKDDVLSCLYSLRAKSILTVVRPTKKSPVWSLAGAESPFTLYELSSFDHEMDDPEYAANCRGDVVNSKWEYAGHFDFQTRVHDPFAKKPADWESLM